ncbi:MULTISPECIES: MBL fold metallo-hydrolase [Rhodococcus]|uniref:MBL fold metallo-hydrolase n=1 Tax=Rhodococcus oxybenzonivorans TaxID=1990687 RepID=A0AAE4UZC2_9NOCA|nr:MULTISPECIES: MBL fold metallo-hydrolase [Rhodococcus]MDV7240554.1 MBL fold metallo-hydrolase [Rhodococcus oxybenzonivorans]MDV7265751.1 MBL fold metallo-hydrolase [Rhodococcus oxybenzonivorans]MDV7272827.1 MBL fold metallo-hydrolase [Rhodococcus oxybenzonivorans]MDV7333434.1 MBL fold metallo-hydrolase [Rhodococcus oxybenzonivorans]MDV7342601.1 MBL fold metallo-hydrolase [Rhodococcus oxybenzonivorans]
MLIDSVIDGENLCTPEFIYPDVDPAEFEKYTNHYESVTGSFVVSIGSFLVRYNDKVVLFDVGLGPKPIYPMTGGALRSSLIALGVDPAEVTDIVFTHLHFDHYGWISHNGEAVFPNATLHCDKRDWDFFVDGHRHVPEWESMASTPETDAAPIKFAPFRDSIRFWEGGGCEILPGITTIDAPGHTPGTVVFELSSSGERGLILGDLVHTIPEFLEVWPFLVAEDQAAARRSILAIRELACRDELPCVGSHFPGLRWGRISREGDAYAWKGIADQ